MEYQKPEVLRRLESSTPGLEVFRDGLLSYCQSCTIRRRNWKKQDPFTSGVVNGYFRQGLLLIPEPMRGIRNNQLTHEGATTPRYQSLRELISSSA